MTSGRDDFRQMLTRLGNLRSRELRRALEQHGWIHDRTEGGHHHYVRGRHSITVPERLKGLGTARNILKRAIAVDEEESDDERGSR